ncbi:MAG: hypothetical protein V1494_00275 [Candidatus Diapherotrites archaeon]
MRIENFSESLGTLEEKKIQFTTAEKRKILHLKNKEGQKFIGNAGKFLVDMDRLLSTEEIKDKLSEHTVSRSIYNVRELLRKLSQLIH